MWRIFVIALYLGVGLFISEATHHAVADHSPHPDVHPIRDLPQVAGRPYEEVQAVVDRHRSELMQVPHVYIVGVGGKGILVGVYAYTDSQGKKPTTLPASLQALPADIEGLPLQLHPLYVLPPPPGVTILRPNGVREAAEACPRKFIEHSKFGWTFCIDPGHPQSIPAMMTPPIAGIPYEECLKILERHQDELIQLDGVDGVGIGSEGIDVYTSNPDVVPLELEGLPVKTKPPLGPGRTLSHTTSNPPVRPLHGGVSIGIPRSPLSETLTGVVLSEGKPWLVFPTHFLSPCDMSSPCPPASSSQSSVLNTCPHNVSVSGTQDVVQPPTPGTAPRVGFVQRWDPLRVNGSTTDVAAAFMDNDFVEGNGSLRANREQEEWTGSFGFTGLDNPPVMNELVSIVSRNPPHVIVGGVTNPSTNVPGIRSPCVNNQLINLTHQMIVLTDLGPNVTPSPIPFSGGDSGSAVLDGAGGLVGMINWGLDSNRFMGGGTIAPEIRRKLNFDFWYGMQSVKDNTYGVYHSAIGGSWVLDNGDGTWSGCGSSETTEECLSFGVPGDQGITGNWGNPPDPQTPIRIGTYRPSTGSVVLDMNGNGWQSSEGCSVDRCTTFLAGTQWHAVAGDWNDDGQDTIGVWNIDTQWWVLDNGDGVFNGCSFNPPWDDQNLDRCGLFGNANDKPVVGDWDGDGRDEVAVYANGVWWQDLNENLVWDEGDASRCCFGLADDLPVGGDWTGTGFDKIGVRHSSMFWVLDNGDFTWSGPAQEQIYGPFGLVGDSVVRWNKSKVKAN